MGQQAEGIRETDPAEGSVDPHSLIELQDTKMIQRLFEKMRESMPSRTITKAPECEYKMMDGETWSLY